ncbi:MAG: exonuclease SbcCD subunit D [Anaerolineae bacterium]|nr:exonuclease SbcCD subunit D [Anaerolineae bacterium]MDW8100819.1 exonuclease SbcCD subunit D [Anaerolineae bacterium]
MEYMIRVLHFADLHLGIENYGRLDPQTGLSTRLVDFLRAFDSLVDFAAKEAVDLVIFAGDAFKTRDPSPTHQREFARRIHHLAHVLHIPTFLLVGNHDLPNIAGHAHAIEIFQTLNVENVWVARRPGIYRIDTRHGIAQIVALPWITRSALLAREEFKNLSLEEIHQLMLNKLENLIQGPAGLVSELDPALPTILVAHGTVQGAVYGSERNIMLGRDLVLPLSLMRHPAFDYVALGHIHKHQCLAEDPPIVYCGSLERIDFGEAEENKGFVLVELDKGRARWRFVPVNARQFITIHVRVDGENPTQQVLEAITAHPIQDAVVRLTIQTTPQANAKLDDAAIRRALAPAFHIAAITREVERPTRLRLGSQESIEALTPLQLLERYLITRQMAPERIAVLLRYARQLMAAEE